MPYIAPEFCEIYRSCGKVLVEEVTALIAGRADIRRLIGSNPIEMMESNHIHHHAFISDVLELDSLELLDRMVPWVYRTYLAHGFSPDYFLAEFAAWEAAVLKHLPPEAAMALIPLYERFKERHAAVVSLVQNPPPMPPRQDAHPFLEEAVQAMLSGDARALLEIGKGMVAGREWLADFYVNLLTPALYRVGELWEKGRISVAHEHLATSTVNHVFSYFYLTALGSGPTKGRAIVTASVNEFHAVGANMLSDLLIADGWSVANLGANTPLNDLLVMVREYKPDLLAVSVCMPFNLTKARDTVRAVRAIDGAGTIKIMLGGQAFMLEPTLVDKVGGDGFALNAVKGVELAATWWKEKTVGKGGHPGL